MLCDGDELNNENLIHVNRERNDEETFKESRAIACIYWIIGQLFLAITI